jgi:hypothetical protein
VNSANNQFMIGSNDFPIDEIRVVQTGGTQCIIDGTGLGCTSDERLKTNITDLSNNILDSLTKVRTVTYNWKANPSSSQMIGFLAQDLEQYFPQLVGTNEQGQKSVNYANMTPILVEAIRELNLKLTDIQTAAATVTDHTGLIAWFADAANGIGDLFAKVIHSDRIETQQLCVGSRCITEDQFNQLLDSQNIHTDRVPVPVVPVSSDSDSTTTDTTTPPQIDPVTPPDGTVTEPVTPDPQPEVVPVPESQPDPVPPTTE